MDVSEKDAARALWKKKRQQKRQHSSFRGRERSHAVGSRVTEKVEVQQQRYVVLIPSLVLPDELVGVFLTCFAGSFSLRELIR